MKTIERIVASLFVLLLILSVKVTAHPWGGLVIDNEGNIYFTFICPIEDSNHYACVWKVTPDNNIEYVLKAMRSPSDIVLTRNLNREIFASERSGQSPNYSNKLWKIENPDNQILIPSTSNQNQFHIQSISVDRKHQIYFSKGNNLFLRDSSNQVRKVNDQNFERINLTAWGPDEEFYFMSGDDIYIYDGEKYKSLISDLKNENPEKLPFTGANIFFDMVIDDNENIYLAYYGNREILKISPNGNIETILRSEEPWSPHGIDFFNGEIYVLESTIPGGKWWEFWKEDPGIIPRVRKITSDGLISTIYEYKN